MNKTNDKFTLGLIQMRCEPVPARNMERAVALIREAAGSGAPSGSLPMFAPANTR